MAIIMVFILIFFFCWTLKMKRQQEREQNKSSRFTRSVDDSTYPRKEDIDINGFRREPDFKGPPESELRARRPVGPVHQDEGESLVGLNTSV
uniref:Uncharacterized protein n=1 Tax=Bursaphelenchus xylophilus TaxID=6326 RepID=A0A1I7RI33_BURXY